MSDKPKVFVLCEGEYSGRFIRGVFSTMEAAEAAAAGNGSGTDIEEHTLDEFGGWSYRAESQAIVDLKSGEIRANDWTYPSFRSPTRECVVEVSKYFVSVFSPVSKEHAIKVAVEKRQEWLRTQGRPTEDQP